MARFFFDIFANGERTPDDEGMEFADLEQVRREALRTLPAVAKDEAAKDGDRQAYTVFVTDEVGKGVYTATMTYAGLWLARQ